MDFFAWMLTDARTTRVKHLSGKNAHVAVFRKAPERRTFSPQSENRFDTSKSNRQLEQTRISIFSWNPGVIEKHMAGKRHITALQEAIEYLQHECLSNHFYISHHARCAVLFNKDTFHSDLRVYSVCIHDVKGGEQIFGNAKQVGSARRSALVQNMRMPS